MTPNSVLSLDRLSTMWLGSLGRQADVYAERPAMPACSQHLVPSSGDMLIQRTPFQWDPGGTANALPTMCQRDVVCSMHASPQVGCDKCKPLVASELHKCTAHTFDSTSNFDGRRSAERSGTATYHSQSQQPPIIRLATFNLRSIGDDNKCISGTHDDMGAIAWLQNGRHRMAAEAYVHPWCSPCGTSAIHTHLHARMLRPWRTPTLGLSR
eukprot:1184384-Amphidinium_carterae.3